MKMTITMLMLILAGCKEQAAPRPTPVTGGGGDAGTGAGGAGSAGTQGAGGSGAPIANATSLAEFCAASSKLRSVQTFTEHGNALCANGAPTALLTQLAGNYFSGNGKPNLTEVAPPVNEGGTTTVFIATSLFIVDAAKQFATVSNLSDADLSRFAKGLIATATNITVTPIQKNTPATVNGLAVITNQWAIEANISNPLPTTIRFALENNYTKISEKTFSYTTHMIKPDETIEDIRQYNAMLTVDGKGVSAVVMKIRAKNSGQPSIVTSVVKDLVSKGVIASQKIAVNGLQ